MSQRHVIQEGTFHVTTNARNGMPWLTVNGIPQILIDNLVMTRNIQCAEVFAFCILPNHMHILLRPGSKGLSAFMQSFKRNTSKDIGNVLKTRAGNRTRATMGGDTQQRSRGSVTPAFTGWQNGFHDERIQDDHQRSHAWRYIMENAVHHNIVETIDDWPWTSLHWEKSVDPMEW